MSPRPVSTFAILTALLIACSSGSSAPFSPAEVGVTVLAGTPDAVIGTPAGGSTAVAGVSATPVSTPGAALTPRPGAPTDLNTAKRLESEGDLEGAAQAYIAAAAANASVRGEATLGAARSLLELEKPADVRVLLEPFVASATGRDVASRYLLARAYAALSMWSQSLEQYDAYIASGRPALPYAYLDRSRILSELNRPADAATSAASGLALGVPGGAKRAFLVAIAQHYEKAGNLSEAIRAYNNVIDGSDLPGDDALALSRIIAIRRSQNNALYAEDMKKLLTGDPGTSQALTVLTEALGRGEPIDPTIKGTVYYRNNDYTKAEPAFRDAIVAAPESTLTAEAYYYLAAILESKNDLETAMTNYAKATSVNPQSTIADDALWWRARILEDAGKRDDARPLFARIVSEYPSSTWAPEAAFRRGMLAYGAGKYQDAVTAWQESLTATTDAAERQRLTFWQAKALQKAGNNTAARPLLEQLARDAEDDYYGIRAVSLLNSKHDEPKATRESKLELTSAPDYAAAETWLASMTGRAVADPGWSGDYRWGRAQELWLVGRSSQADGEAFDLMEANARDSIAMYTMSRSLQGLGRTGMSGRAGQRLLRTLNKNPNEGLPRALLSLSYPPAFGASAQKHAQSAGISPLLLLAFVRQESFFDPRAESPVGALGLTQVLPATGKQLAGRLGVSGFSNDDLLEADLNLRFGASYMADQLKDFDSEIFVAFAAYNAGPNGARRWRKTAGQDADVFVETIEFRETRLYVEIVAENYAIYRYLYGGSSVPNLPD